jgi:hypothetical protein
MRDAPPTDLNKISNPELRAPLLELKQQQDRARLHPVKLAPKTNGAATGPRSHTASETINIEEIAKLSPINYDRQREALSEKLGVRLSTLDEAVKAARRVGAPGQGTSVTVEDVVPWPESVDGETLLDEMAMAIMSHIAISAVEADTIALWCVYNHAYELFPVSPRLGIRAATAECGKTELLRRIRRFVNRPLECDGLSAAVFFRLVDASKPTLLLDELDNCLPEDKGAILGAMNSGYSRKGRFFRCVGDYNEVRAFSTFAPFAYAMIGKPIGTFDSRTIPIELRRASPEKARCLTSLEDDSPEDKRLFDLGRKVARWTEDNRDRLKGARPDMGDLVNRAAMNWRPLFVVAHCAGGTWPERARKAAVAAMAVRADQDIKTELIIDIKTILDAAPTVHQWPSALLVEQLVGLEGRPWAEFGKPPKAITQNALARLLKPLGISPQLVGTARKSGYLRWQFKEVFEAYASPPPVSNLSTSQTAMESTHGSHFQPLSEIHDERLEECEKRHNDEPVRGREVSEGGAQNDHHPELPEF